MLRSKHRIVSFALRPLDKAITPAKSSAFCVKSKCKRLVDSGRNSASIMAAADVRDVLERKSRLRAVFKVKAVRKEVICEGDVSNLMHFNGMGLTPSTPGPQQGFLLMSRVSRVVLYFWPHVRDTDYLNQVQPHQGFGDADKPVHTDLVVRKVKDLECPIPFKDLRDVRNAILANHAFSKMAPQLLHWVLP